MMSLIILSRILSAACMVFIVGYVFGSFAKKPILASITKVATILAIVLFVSTSVAAFRGGPWRQGSEWKHGCMNKPSDSVTIQPAPAFHE